jgi:DNA-directed RNA polymerase subunit RPC12/RpoP
MKRCSNCGQKTWIHRDSGITCARCGRAAQYKTIDVEYEELRTKGMKLIRKALEWK